MYTDQGTTMERFIVLLYLAMKSAGGSGSGIETPLHKAEATVAYTCIRVKYEKVTCVFIVHDCKTCQLWIKSSISKKWSAKMFCGISNHYNICIQVTPNVSLMWSIVLNLDHSTRWKFGHRFDQHLSMTKIHRDVWNVVANWTEHVLPLLMG